MKSRWNATDAAKYIDRYAQAHGEDVALRVYTSRLIGQDAELVMHGGGNTSVKSSFQTILGESIDALFVKGSGWDLESIEPAGLPGVDLAYLRRLRALKALTDEEMVNQLRTHLFDNKAPTPSVEALLHAFLPHKYVDHTHADVAIVVTNQVHGFDLAREAFGDNWVIVPYVMPGFDLACKVADAVVANPNAHGVVLMNHGLISFSDDARESYERMIQAVDRAEQFVEKRSKKALSIPAAQPATSNLSLAQANMAIALRAAISEAPNLSGQGQVIKHQLVVFRDIPELLPLLNREDAKVLLEQNPLTPDHVIRTKGPALVFDGTLPFENLDALKEQVVTQVSGYRERYQKYFDDNKSFARSPVTRLDPSPRVIWVKGLGLFTVGINSTEASIAADIAEHTLKAKTQAADLGQYQALSNEDLFCMEYWSLEQAKLGKGSPPVLTGQIALVTGAAGAIGFAICKKLVAHGASVVVTDRDYSLAEKAANELDPKKKGVAFPLALDVTQEQSVISAFEQLCRRYGGLDIAVLNAGIARTAKIEQTSELDFRQVLDVNLMGAFLVLREAAKLFRLQNKGGHVVLNSSKNVFAPGAEFSTYSASKAAAHQLCKVAAIELAPIGVQVNMINADGIFSEGDRPSGLWQEVGPKRAKARGVEIDSLPEFYRQRNLLKAKVTGEHVANAVLFFVSNQIPATGATLPVDGGIAEAFPR